MMKRRKILIEAYTCAPNRGSEPGLGWNIVSRLGKEYEVYAIVEAEKWREEIEAFCDEHPEETAHLHFRYIVRERHRLLRKIWPPSYYWYYRKWQKMALEEARLWNEQEEFDLVHHVTMAGFRAPGYLWKLGKPFIWGPIGGLNNSPWHLLPQLGVKGALFLAFRNLFNAIDKRWSRDVHRAAQSASFILSSTKEGTQDIRRFWKREALDFCELGVDSLSDHITSISHHVREPLRVVWVGLLTPRKALPILLKSLSHCSYPIELHVVGDGEMRNTWERMAGKCNGLHRVIFHGLVSHDEVQRIISNCHVGCITSVRDDTSSVTFEYLQQGIPVIALAHCGFGTVIDDSCGVLIQVRGIRYIEKDIAEALCLLATDESQRKLLSKGALTRAHQYTWDAKMRFLKQCYDKALSCR